MFLEVIRLYLKTRKILSKISLKKLQMKEKKILNPFYITGLFLYPSKLQQTKGFLMFSAGIERDQ